MPLFMSKKKREELELERQRNEKLRALNDELEAVTGELNTLMERIENKKHVISEQKKMHKQQIDEITSAMDARAKGLTKGNLFDAAKAWVSASLGNVPSAAISGAKLLYTGYNSKKASKNENAQLEQMMREQEQSDHELNALYDELSVLIDKGEALEREIAELEN